MITHKQQKKNSYLCGQTCIAMILNISLKKSIQLCKTDHITYSKDLEKALGIVKPNRVWFNIRNKKKSIVFIKKHNSNIGHWVVSFDGQIYDPKLKKPMKVSIYRNFLKNNNIGRMSFRILF